MFTSLRIFRKLQRSQPVAHMAIMCQGKPISREDLFKYTNGRFLANEEHQLARRYRKFNLDALCDVAASAGGNTSRISAIEKFEGGFSKALLMTKENGSELIAKIPLRIAGPAVLTTASEVGTLEYIRRYTSIPVPRVFSWSTDESNPVGAEYIIMEKAPGVQLYERWGEMKVSEKLEIVKLLAQLEGQLSAISFPAYGGLYLRSDADRLRHHDLDASLDEQQSFCIGPSPDRSFGVDAVAGTFSEDGSIYNGPYFDTLDEDEKALARRRYEQALGAKAYEIRTFLDKRPAHNAMADAPRLFRDLFIRAGEVFTTGITPLRESLLEMSQHWTDLGFSSDCPYSFSPEELEAHRRDSRTMKSGMAFGGL
ncbi:hypothetical protein BJX62DRAFT_237435 [Aspergillus germanicus]